MPHSFSSRSRRRLLIIFGSYVLLTLALTWPAVQHFGNAIPGDGFDGWQNLWNLWWVKRALLHLHTSPYFTTLLYHPSGVGLWFQTLNIFNGITFLPVQLAGNLFWAYNLVVLFSFSFAGFGAYLLGIYVLHRAGATSGAKLHAAGFLSGVIFTFSPFHFAHLLGHMQVFSLQFIPFFALYLFKSLEPASSRRHALMAALFLTLAALCDWYFVLYLLFFTILYLLWLGIQHRLLSRNLFTLAIIFGATLLVTSPLLGPMVFESLRYDFMKPPPGQIEALSGDVLGFLIPSGLHSIWGDWAATLRQPLSASPSENTLYLGVIAALLGLVGAWRWRQKLGFWLLVLFTFALFALGPTLHVNGQLTGIPLPYGLILKLPFVAIARTVARYDLLVMLSLGVLAGGGLYALLEKVRKRRTALGLAAILVLLVLLDFTPIPYPVSLPDTPPFYKTLAIETQEGAVLNLPMEWDRPGYLLYQTVHGKPLTAGYISRTDPRTLPGRVPVISRFRHLQKDINWVDDIEAIAPTLFEFLDIHWLILDRYKMPPGATRDYNEALTGELFGSTSPSYQDNRLTVYELAPPAQRFPFVEIGWDFGPLEPGPTRSVAEAASLVLHVPRPGDYLLTITPAPENTTSWRLVDTEGVELLASAGGTRSITFPLNTNQKTLTIQALGPGLNIHHIEIKFLP